MKAAWMAPGAREVPDDGSPYARIVLIGEAPGRTETEVGRPFVGRSGVLLEQWWRKVGLSRAHMYITNVVPIQPGGNKIAAVPKELMHTYIHQLHERLALLEDPWLIVPMGNTALYALTGFREITKRRGSIYQYTDLKGRALKVIPTLHPAYTMHTSADVRDERSEWFGPPVNQQLVKACIHDWEKIARECQYPDIRIPERNIIINPTIEQLEIYYGQILDEGICAVDIETPGGVLDCIGFSYTPESAIVVSMRERDWGDQWLNTWDIVRSIIGHEDIMKVTQNGHFDMCWLADEGMDIGGWQWDTLAMSHALDATEKHALDYQASVLTNEPYWKDESKGADGKFGKVPREQLHTYCGKDVAVDLEIAYIRYQQLEERGLLDFYQTHYANLLMPLLRMMRHGIRVDTALARRRQTACLVQVQEAREALASIAGYDLFAVKGFSPTKLAKFLYADLAMKRMSGSPSDEATIRRLMGRYKKKFHETGQLILNIRQQQKLAEFYDTTMVDPDGYIRCTYKFNTVTGRLASSKNPRRTGRNLQNIESSTKDLYMADPGHVLVALDASQIESRIVGCLTGDPELIRLAQSMPWEFDIHRHNGSLIMSVIRGRPVPPEEITKEERNLFKRTVHASNYLMGKRRLRDILLNEGIDMEEKLCGQFISAYLDSVPAVREWQNATKEILVRDRRIVTSFGRMLDMSQATLNDEAWKSAVAFRPQSEAASIINLALGDVSVWLVGNALSSSLIAQVHDELLFSCPPDEAFAVYQQAKKCMEKAYLIGETLLSVPAQVKVGSRWKGMHEWKQPPSEQEFTSKVEEYL